MKMETNVEDIRKGISSYESASQDHAMNMSAAIEVLKIEMQLQHQQALDAVRKLEINLPDKIDKQIEIFMQLLQK